MIYIIHKHFIRKNLLLLPARNTATKMVVTISLVMSLSFYIVLLHLDLYHYYLFVDHSDITACIHYMNGDHSIYYFSEDLVHKTFYNRGRYCYPRGKKKLF